MNAVVIIWDRITRLIHWAIAILCVLNLFVLEEGETAHQWIGYSAAGLVGLRIIWGFIGGTESRFRNFPLHPRQVKSFLSELLPGRTATDYPGHNPLGALTYLIIWGVILGLGISGWLLTLDQFFGSESLEEAHELLSSCLKILVLLHFAGMIRDAIKFRRKTWLAMILGRRG